MPKSSDVRARTSIMSRCRRVAGASALVAAVVVAAPSAAWAGAKHPPAHHSSHQTVNVGGTQYTFSGNPNYGWVIPITFVYAPGYGPR